MTSKVTLHRTFPGEPGYQLVAVFELDPATGSARVTITDEGSRVKVEKLLDGVGARSLRRLVLPDEGELFLDTLLEAYARSSYWRARDDSSERAGSEEEQL